MHRWKWAEQCNVSSQANLDNLEGRQKEAWVVDYVDTEGGKRRLKTFEKKKDATDNFAATANVEIRAGVHTADSASMTIAEAGKLWIETGEENGPGARDARGLSPAPATAYRALSRQRETVATLRADGARVRGQARAGDMPDGRRVRSRDRRDGPQDSGLAVVADQRRARARPCLA